MYTFENNLLGFELLQLCVCHEDFLFNHVLQVNDVLIGIEHLCVTPEWLGSTL